MREPTNTDVNDALASIARAEGKPLIEETIGPAEVHTLGPPAARAPQQPAYMSIRADIWMREQCEIEELRKAIDNEKMLRDAVMVVSARKDRDYYVMCGVAALLGVALAGCLGVMAWRVA